MKLLDEKSLSELLPTHKISASESQTMIKILGRCPSYAELGVFSALWSEHCSYKSSKIHLSRFPTRGENVVVPPGENAGVVRLKDNLCVAFKMESHNHPSYIEPYQGAATGVGGIMRDVFCMGARPIANFNCLRFGRMGHPRTPYLLREVVKGIGDYGNCIGVPTVGGQIAFHASYDGNCLVNAMCVGLIDEDKIWKGSASGVGNVLVYVGSATGRDGIHGATMASDSFSSAAAGERATVQVGDPFLEKLLMEATLEVLAKDLVVGLQDMGAAGLTSSAFEMAERAGLGLNIILDQVPIRTKTPMTPYELLLSESQERMLMVVEPQKLAALTRVFDNYNLHHAVIGDVVEIPRVRCTYEGECVVDIPVDGLSASTPRYERAVKFRSAVPYEAFSISHPQKILQAAACFDYPSVYEQYDRHIGLRTLRDSEHGGAALLEIFEQKSLGIAVATGCLERYVAADPFLGAAHSVLRCFRAISCVGATPLAITDCLNFGNPEKPEVMGDISRSVDGISSACRELGISVVSGNVSLYNETDGQSILPTPMIGMVAKMDETVDIPYGRCLQPDLDVYMLALNKGHLCASFAEEFERHKITASLLPAIDWKAEHAAHDFIREHLVDIVMCRDVGVGGLAATIVKSFEGFKISSKQPFSCLEELFYEGGACYLMVLKKELTHEHLVKIGSTRAKADGYDFGFFRFDKDY